MSSYDKLIENEEGKKNSQKKKIFFFEGSGRNRYRKHEAQSNIQLTKHNRNAATQNNLPSQATLGFHLPQLLPASMDSWEAGKPRKAVQFQFQSKTLIIPRNGCKFSIYKSWFLLNLKHQMCKGKPAVINRVPGAHGAWETCHKPPDFCPKLQGSKTDKSRSGSVSEIWMHDTVNVLHVHSYNFWECFWLPIKTAESLDYILIMSVFLLLLLIFFFTFRQY